MSKDLRDPVKPEPALTPPPEDDGAVELSDEELRATFGGYVLTGHQPPRPAAPPTGITPFTVTPIARTP